MRRASNNTVRVVVAVTTVLLGAACGSSGDEQAATPSAVTATPATDATVTDAAVTEATGPPNAAEQRFPDVIDADAVLSGSGWTFSVTISSPYDTPARYADAWRVLGPDGTEYGIRVLTHDHAAEQPFTRSLSGIGIPDGVDVVTIEGRDLVHGWGGTTFDVVLP